MKSIFIPLAIISLIFLAPIRAQTEGKNFNQKSKVSINNSIAEVIAYRELHLLKGVTDEDFEVFTRNKLIPTFDQNVPGVTIKIMRGERGEKKGVYVLLLIFDSVNTRNFYFPTEQHGETNMPEESLRLWRPGQIMLIEELDKYIEPLEENLFTDFDVLK